MEKCFITKLNGIVSSPDILKLGEMRINVTKLDNPTSKTQYFSFTFNEKSDIEIIGDGYFTNENLSVNYGKKKTVEPNTDTIIYVSNGDFGLSIFDKYSLKNIVVFTLGYSISNKKMSDIEVLKFSKNLTNLNLPNTQVSGDIGGLKTLTALTNLNLPNTQVSGDIGGLKTLTALTNLNLPNTQVSGDIGGLKTLTALTNLNLPNTQVSGDIGGLKTLTALTSLSLYNTQVSGDIGGLKTLTALTSLSLYNTQVPHTGNIGELSALSKCTEILIKYSKLSGDLATLPSVCRFVSFDRDKGSVFTWSERPSSAKILAIQGTANLTNVDKMLQDQAQCQVGFSASDASWYKTIFITGTRTSASDAAVQTLQSKGYTVSITPA
jgi:hypothetical protein